MTTSFQPASRNAASPKTAFSARRRSPLAPRLQELGAPFAPFGEDSSLVENLQIKLGRAKVPKGQARQAEARLLSSELLLCDLSPLTRIGVKGQGVENLLKRSALVAPKLVNESVVQKDGSLCLRLAEGEVLLLSALDSKGEGDFTLLRRHLEQTRTTTERTAQKTIPKKKNGERNRERNAFPVPYQDSLCWLALAGDGASDMLATMCAVDLRDGIFARGSLAQTSLARLSALVLRAPAAGIGSGKRDLPLFYLLADSASSLYLWDCLLDAISAFEQGGVVCGRQDLLRRLSLNSPRRA